MPIGIGIIEDHTEFRQSIEYLVSTATEYSITWSVSSAEEALKEKADPEIVLLDINLPGMKGIDAISLLKKKYDGLKVIMLTIHEDDHHILEAVRNGADGYILKKANRNKILEAIKQVYEGGGALTPSVARQVMAFLKPEKSVKDIPILTPREKEILWLITQGMINEKIAAELYISPETVRNHIRNIYDKLQVHSRSQVVAKAIREGLV